MEVIALIAGVVIVALGITAFTGAPYIPTKKHEINEAFDGLRPLTENDMVLDLGSGDGVVLRVASTRGARAVGYELSPFLVMISRFLSRRDSGVRIEFANIFTKPFPDDVTLVYVFGDGRDISKMTKRIESEAGRLGRSIQVLSYGFKLYGYEPIKTHRAHSFYEIGKR